MDYLVQGTIYPDVIESGAGDAAVIKSHHNVGGLPDYVDFKEIIEPCGCSSRTRCGSWAGSWACLNTWSCVSLSRVLACHPGHR